MLSTSIFGAFLSGGPDLILDRMADRAQQVLDEDYEELLERLRVADFLYTEYSLEEVIYQLAKVMFSQSLNREAQEALQKFTTFLEAEAEQGHMSRSLEKKVLGICADCITDRHSGRASSSCECGTRRLVGRFFREPTAAPAAYA
ncbi:hypothetical protein C0J52_18079 [Blattella germanica]|nr:hypothetical protein C0J52_18079 [Blattella germanica]